MKLVYVEEGDRIEDAYRREKQIQGWSRKKKQALIAGDSNALHRLAECRNDSHWSLGFDSAQPTSGSAAFGSAQAAQSAVGSDQSALLMPSDEPGRSLSEVEGQR